MSISASLARAAGAIGLFALGTHAAFAQTTAPPPPPPLTDLVTNPMYGATPLEINAGIAVQKMCSYLTKAGFSPKSPQAQLQTPQGDLFLRCNELVETARGILAQPGATSRSLKVPAPALLGAVQQISGNEFAAQGTLTTQVISGQFANIASRINALRYGTDVLSLRGRVTALNSSSDGMESDQRSHDSSSLLRALQHDQDANEGNDGLVLRRVAYTLLDEAESPAPAAQAPLQVHNPWGVFTEGSYIFGRRDPSADDDGFHYNAESVTLGLDYNFGHAVAGASVGYDYYKADFQSNGATVAGGNARVEGTTGSLFGAWFAGHWNLNGIVSYGSLNTDLLRVVAYSPASGAMCAPPCGASRTLRGTPDGKDFAVGLSAGYDVYVGPATLTPSLSVNFRHINIDSFSETDLTAPPGGSGLPLDYGEQTIESLRSIVGFIAAVPLSESFGVLSPYLRFDWDHEYRNGQRSLAARYLADPSTTCVSCFAIPTQAPAEDFGVVGVGLSALFSNRLQAYLSYERLVGVSYLTSNAIILGVRGQF